MSYETTAEILNFGAFLGFMGVNLAVVWQFWVRRAEGRQRKIFADIVLPGLGFVFCTIIWLGLGAPAKIAGGMPPRDCWLLFARGLGSTFSSTA